MKVLILVEDYPDLCGGLSLYYVHTRNLFYQKQNIEVTVLNFRAKENYFIDEIQVITLKSFISNYKDKRYGEVLLLHAPNLKNHLKFLLLYGHTFKKYIFFFHGHEVLRVSKVYPKPYNYIKKNMVLNYVRDVYDILKLKIWKKVFLNIYLKSEFVFVSCWMYREFLEWVKIDKKFLDKRRHIIYNSIGKKFETYTYNPKGEKQYDFICLRSNFDASKYCIDTVCEIAQSNPKCKFCLIGKGDYFNYNRKPDNIIIISEYLNHEKILMYLDMSRCALMPTKTDAQGVMACEMATYGIPLITSDIPVCREVFQGFKNVGFLHDNDTDVLEIYGKIKDNILKNEKYYEKNTTQKEVELIKSVEF